MTDATATPTSTPLLFGRYRVSELLGETRLAAVYVANDERLQRRVLLHLLRKELVGQERPRERFLKEIGESARRSHQALLEVFDSGDASGRPFMITEYVSGRALYGLGRLTLEQSLLYVRQVASAIAVCQAQRGPDTPTGLYHPPISSTNVLLVDEGRVKLVDSWQIAPGEVLGELAYYRAPELSQGQPASPASDVYALGLLLYELISGERPISGADPRSIALAHLSARIPPLSQVRPGLYMPTAERLVARATARLPEQRFGDAQAFGDALDTLWRDLGATTQQLNLPSRPARRAQMPTNTLRPAPARATAAPAIPAVVPSSEPTPDVEPPRRGARRQAGVDRRQMQQRNMWRGLFGWVVMICLLLMVAAGSFLVVNSLAERISGLPRPNLPSMPSLPTATTGGGPLDWVRGLFRRDEIYIVNNTEGLRLRSSPGLADDASILTVVPNGTPVHKLEGPVYEDNVPWLRVSVEVSGERFEGWMSMNYLKPE